MKLLVFTAGFYDRDYDQKLEKLSKSSEVFDIKLNIYGRGHFFSFFESKINKLGIYLNKFKKDYTHALFTDAADTLFLSSVDEIIKKYEAQNSPPLLLSGEKSCYPFSELISRFPDTVGPWRFFNAGGFIGEIQYILDTVSRLKSFYYVNNNDNAHWMLAYNEHKIDLSIDHGCQIFQTMSDVDFGREVGIIYSGIDKRNRVKNFTTGSLPSIIHFNGPKGDGTRNDKLMNEVFLKCVLNYDSI